MKLQDILAEGIFDRFKKKPKPQMIPVTPEQRALIKQHFPDNNGSLRRSGPDSDYVLPLNVKANYGHGEISFRNEDGQLIASVAFYPNVRDVGNPRVSPYGHYDVVIGNEHDTEKLKGELK